jgi:hypothetical protein
MAIEMPTERTDVMSQYTSSPAYAHQNGKPVVGIWGFGFNDTNHPWAAADCLSVIQWFQSQGWNTQEAPQKLTAAGSARVDLPRPRQIGY